MKQGKIIKGYVLSNIIFLILGLLFIIVSLLIIKNEKEYYSMAEATTAVVTDTYYEYDNSNKYYYATLEFKDSNNNKLIKTIRIFNAKEFLESSTKEITYDPQNLSEIRYNKRYTVVCCVFISIGVLIIFIYLHSIKNKKQIGDDSGA